MGGLEATKKIRAFEAEHQLRPCVIIAMHACSIPEPNPKALEVGCDAILRKPLQARPFLELLFGDEKHNILHQRGRLTEEEARSLSLAPRPPYLEPDQRLPSTRRKQARLQQRILDLSRLLALRPKDYDTREQGFINARAALKTIRATFENTNLEYERTLGFGGYGIAAKYAHRNRAGQHVRHVVVKAPLKPNNSSGAKAHQREHEWYRWMKGMEHVPLLLDPVQLYQSPPPGSDSNAPGQSRQYIFNWDAKDRYIITEFLEHGELNSLVERLNETVQNQPGNDLFPMLTFIPSRLLWRIFLCLLRGVIAMAWPNIAMDWRTEMKQEQPTMTEETLHAMLEDLPLREVVGPQEERMDIAHFDLDVYNIFLGQSRDPNDEEHKFVKAVVYERKGKRRWMAPEQFLGMLPNQTTWNYKTNLWGIGATMCALMTKATLPSEPHLKTCEDATFTYPSGEKIVVPQTFAHFLGDDESPDPSGQYVKYRMFGRFDVDLRYTVATLMARDLDIRGTLDLLLLTITGQIEEGDERARKLQVPAWETDAAIRKFVDDHLKNAPEKVFPRGRRWRSRRRRRRRF
ncbi:hypothetical protein PG991_011509 [Apiospora marii]|uniref:Protein kinase domain-containing protein n=1 Tax=Apiospora marii TaxID=335849 RepID=A0ABR1RFG2_9PEZI